MGVSGIKALDAKIKPFIDAELEFLAQAVTGAHQAKKQVIVSMGAHPLRTGNSRYFIDLMERGIITHIATNGAVPIHDFELALIGATLEDVEFYIKDGSFGHWRETGEAINGAIVRGFQNGWGLGEAIGRMIEDETYCPMPYKEVSVFAAAYRLGVPITVHKGIGYDTTDQHPSADFQAIGQTSGDDFLMFADSVSKLQDGVFLCLGTQVMGPEVYLKALAMARNVAEQQGQKINRFTTAVFDLVDLGDWQAEADIVNYRRPETLQDQRYYFRPLKSILVRTVRDGGWSFYVRGDFSVTIPALYHRIVELTR